MEKTVALLDIAKLNPLSKEFFLVAKVVSKTDLRDIPASGTSSTPDACVFNIELGDPTVRKFFFFSFFLFFSNIPGPSKKFFFLLLNHLSSFLSFSRASSVVSSSMMLPELFTTPLKSAKSTISPAST